MKRFRFPLQPLRILREQREQAAQRRYADVLRDVEAAEVRVARTVAELEACWLWLREDLTDGAFADRLEATRIYGEVLGERRKQEEAALSRERERLNQAWHTLMLATREREILDRFFEKCQREYDLALQREEQKLLDEIGTRLVIGAAHAERFVAASMESV